jgi:post-segregation antitoxin (ccd killing protein)
MEKIEKSQKMTVFVSDELIERLKKKHPEINWAEVVRAGLIKKLEKLEKLEARGQL